MTAFFALLMLASLIGVIVGLIKPAAFTFLFKDKAKRPIVTTVFGFFTLLSFFLIGVSAQSETEEDNKEEEKYSYSYTLNGELKPPVIVCNKDKYLIEAVEAARIGGAPMHLIAQGKCVAKNKKIKGSVITRKSPFTFYVFLPIGLTDWQYRVYVPEIGIKLSYISRKNKETGKIEKITDCNTNLYCTAEIELLKNGKKKAEDYTREESTFWGETDLMRTFTIYNFDGSIKQRSCLEKDGITKETCSKVKHGLSP